MYEWNSFEPLENALIEVNSTPIQYFVAADATYTLNLSPGSYLITARYFEGDKVIYTAEETVTISDDGDYVLDILLFPEYEEDLLGPIQLDDIDRDFEEGGLVTEKSFRNSVYALLLLVLCSILGAGWYFRKKGNGKGNGNDKENVTVSSPINHSESFEYSGKETGSLKGKAGPELHEEIESSKEAVRIETAVRNKETLDDFSETVPEELTSGIDVGKLDDAPAERAPGPEYELRNEETPGQELNENTAPLVSETVAPELNETLDPLANESVASELNETLDPLANESVAPELNENTAPLVDDAVDLELNETVEAALPEEPDVDLPEDLQEVMGLIRANGNRITQKELRKKCRYSESKVSLMLSDLEDRGLIEKFKKGRGNIIRIPDRYIRLPEKNHEGNTSEGKATGFREKI